MSLSRHTMLLIGALFTFSCGILFPGPSLPSITEVAAAKIDQKREWALLEVGRDSLDENFYSGSVVVNKLIVNNKGLVRLRLLLQDYELQHLDYDEVLYKYQNFESEQKNAISALLLARVLHGLDARLASAELALERDEQLLAARVFVLGTKADIGEPKLINQLVQLLSEHPGCAEGWRLLANLAPVYSRNDYAARAAQTEPWNTSAAGQEHANKCSALTLLQAGSSSDIEDALFLSNEINDDYFSKMILAAVYAKQQRAVEALDVINKVLIEYPDDAIAIFNRAILLRDYLSRSLDAIADLQKFLDLTTENAQLHFLRRSQAEFWLAER
ncbi:MAG: hypothetical protein H8E25_11230 [Planctomycetes bacterium]|nr:hypothetical protein [Planctomycetota bacterium]